MTRLAPDDAREAEIRRFLVNYDPQSDLPFIVGRLDAVRAERDEAIRERVSANDRFCPQHRGEWRSYGCVACGVIAGGETERQLRADLAAAQARLAEVTQERDAKTHRQSKGLVMTSLKTDLHVEPVDDLREHDQTRTCWCHPDLQQEGTRVIVIHHSADGRELVEEHGVN
jgi:hypothetical protein